MRLCDRCKDIRSEYSGLYRFEMVNGPSEWASELCRKCLMEILQYLRAKP